MIIILKHTLPLGKAALKYFNIVNSQDRILTLLFNNENFVLDQDNNFYLISLSIPIVCQLKNVCIL